MKFSHDRRRRQKIFGRKRVVFLLLFFAFFGVSSSKLFSVKKIGLYKNSDEMSDWAQFFLRHHLAVFFLPLIHSKYFPHAKAIVSQSFQECNGGRDFFGDVSFFSGHHCKICLIFTSKRAVDFFCEIVRNAGKDRSFYENFLFLALGGATGEALRRRGICVDFQAKTSNQEGVFCTVKEIYGSNPSIHFFYFRSVQARNFLREKMRENKIIFHDVPFYETRGIFWEEEHWEVFEKLDIMILGSSSTVRALKTNLFWRTRRKKLEKHPLYVLLGSASERIFLDFRDDWREKKGQLLCHKVVEFPFTEGILSLLR